MPSLASNHKFNTAFVVIAAAAYVAITLAAPKEATTASTGLAFWVIAFITLTILGLWLANCFYGFYSWLLLDRYATSLENKSDRKAFGQIASAIRLLVYTLLVSSLLTGLSPYFNDNQGIGSIITQVNDYIFLIFPFLGFWWLRLGTRKLTVTTEAALSLRAKFVTVGPPVVVLASFYIFLIATNPTRVGPLVAPGPLAAVAIPIYIALVVGSWVWGLLAALNIERATYGGTAASTRALVRLYNGILVMTGGFIILDALSSLGNARIADLPIGVDVVLLYAFIAVICFGFIVIASSGRMLLRDLKTGEK